MNPSLRRRKRNLLLLAVISVLAYLPAIAGLFVGAWPFADDGITLFNVWRGLGREALQEGALPLWNPYLFCGIPLMANNQSAILYPPNLVYWLLPMASALLIDAIGHNIWLAWGGYFLGRAWKLSRTASFVLACALALSGGVAAHIYNGHMTWHAVRSWLPWELCFLTLYLQTAPRDRALSFRYVLLLAVCIAAQAASGYAPIWVVSLSFCGGLFLVWAIRRGLPPGWFGAALTTGILSAFLAAAYIVPLMEASRLSVHGDGLSFASSTRASGSWNTWARVFLPGFFGNNRPPQWSIPYVPHEEVAYIGLVPLFLALGAPFFARRWGKVPLVVWVLLPLLPLMALLALGHNTPLYRLAYDMVPLVHKTRVPVRWMELFYYMTAILGAFSFDALLHRRQAGARAEAIFGRVLLGFSALCALLFVGAALTPPNSSLWMQRVQQGIGPAPRTAPEQLEFAQVFQGAALLESLLGAAFAGCGFYLFLKWQKAAAPRRRHYERLLLLLIVFDLSSYSWRSVHIVPPQAVREYFSLPTALIEHEYSKEQRWDTLLDFGNTNNLSLHHVSIFNGYDALGQKHYFEFVSGVEGKETWVAHYEVAGRSPLLRVASVGKTLTSSKRLPTVREGFADFKARQIASQGQFNLWKWDGAWPRAYITRNLHRVAENEQLPLLEKLALGDFAAQERPAVVAPGAFSQVAALPLSPQDKVIDWRYDWNRVTLRTSAKAPSLLVFNDCHYPGWKAAVNGQIVPMESANFLFRGVPIPAGEATVQMVYEPQTVRAALFLSLCGLGALSAFIAAGFTRTTSRTTRPRQ
jgi:hypothetical protein